MTDIGDLINQMNPKKKPSEIDMNKKIQTEKQSEKTDEKFKSTIKEVEIDYYKVLGVDPKADKLEIKRAYQLKLKKYHLSKVPNTEENKARYKLIREAGDLLTNQYERKAYDMQRNMESTQKDFKNQKDSFKEFLKLQEQHMTEEDKKIAKLNFDRGMLDTNRKHGYDKNNSGIIESDEYNRRLEDMTLFRDQEEREIEMNQANLFEGREWNKITNAEFNKLFEKKKRRDEKRKKTQGGMTKYNDGISAFNDYDADSGGVAINQYDNLYSEGTYDEYNDSYSGINSGMIGAADGNSDDDISIESPDENSYDNHNKGVSKESLDAAMKKMMADREEQDIGFDKMAPSDYGSAMDDKYGISNQLGFMVGTDKFGHQKNFKKRNIEEETAKAYKELTEK